MDSHWSKVSFNLKKLLLNHKHYLFFSAYCGGLQVAALRSCIEMAQIMNDKDLVKEYDEWLQVAKKSYSEKLWNGQLI